MRFALIICFALFFHSGKIFSQSISCTAYESIQDSIGTPFILEAFFLKEEGWREKNGTILKFPERPGQFPFFIKYDDINNISQNYSKGYFLFINNYSPIRDTLKRNNIFFEEGEQLNEKLSNKKFIPDFRKIGYKSNTTLKARRFTYSLYYLKLKVLFIGKYCRLRPFFSKGEYYTRTPTNIYLILDIEK